MSDASERRAEIRAEAARLGIDTTAFENINDLEREINRVKETIAHPNNILSSSGGGYGSVSDAMAQHGGFADRKSYLEYLYPGGSWLDADRYQMPAGMTTDSQPVNAPTANWNPKDTGLMKWMPYLIATGATAGLMAPAAAGGLTTKGIWSSIGSAFPETGISEFSLGSAGTTAGSTLGTGGGSTLSELFASGAIPGAASMAPELTAGLASTGAGLGLASQVGSALPGLSMPPPTLPGTPASPSGPIDPTKIPGVKPTSKSFLENLLDNLVKGATNTGLPGTTGQNTGVDSVLGGLFQYLAQKDLADKQAEAARMASAQSDPFASQRQQYWPYLQQLLTGDISGMPAYQAGIKGVNARSAGLGKMFSGENAIENINFGADFINKSAQPLLVASGASTGSPQAAGYLASQGLNTAAVSDMRGLTGLGAAGKGLYDLVGGSKGIMDLFKGIV